MPGPVMFFLFTYAAILIISVFRLLANPSGWEQTFGYMFSEYVINGFKWVLPGLLLFEGCRSRKHTYIAVGAILLIYLLLAVQVIRWVPFGSGKGARFIQNEVGYNRVTLSMMLSGASWAMLATVVLFRNWKHKFFIIGAAALIALGQALTGGRSGYASWLGVGFILCLVRWRKFIPVIPIVVVLAISFVPDVRQRVFQGWAQQSGNIVVNNDAYEMTSGRNLAWPAVIAQIKEEPLLGFGREAMTTTGIKQLLLDKYDESFPHPHQAYLEMLLDNGVVGFLCVIPFYLIILYLSLQLVRDREDPLASVVGTICFALVMALMIGAFGGQTFYPREGSVGMWAAIGLMLRFSVERAQQPYGILLAGHEDESDDELQEESAQLDPSV